jgi:hypothetical protein
MGWLATTEVAEPNSKAHEVVEIGDDVFPDLQKRWRKEQVNTSIIQDDDKGLTMYSEMSILTVGWRHSYVCK